MNLQPIQLQKGKKAIFCIRLSFRRSQPPAKPAARKKNCSLAGGTSRPMPRPLFLMGDLFDFWFEYKHAVPKGGVRLLGKLAALSDGGLPIVVFSGNHDMWMKDYFPQEFDIPVYHQPRQISINGKQMLLGHGDGLGPGDRRFKLLKRVFRNPLSIWLFGKVHPDLGIGIANAWSKTSRASHMEKDNVFLGDDEWLLAYCKEVEQQQHHDFYIFGHRHLPLNLEVSPGSRYINLGEWLSHFTYGSFDGQEFSLNKFDDES